jgi:hypothetical protein
MSNQPTNATRPARSRFPWYDSFWLNFYVQATEIVAKHRPERLDDFIAGFDPLRIDPGFNVTDIGQMINGEQMREIRQLIAHLQAQKLERHELARFGRHVVHNLAYFNAMHASLVDLASEAVGRRLEPTYNFLSLYNGEGVCELHMDAPSATFTLDLCIDQSTPWPIHSSRVVPWPVDFNDHAEGWEQRIKDDPDNEFRGHTMEPGKAIIFGGSSQWHYRDRIPNTGGTPYSHLVFFHFVPAQTTKLLRPRMWAEHFNIPELQFGPIPSQT